MHAEDPRAFAPVLRALATGALRWLADEPWLHARRLLAEHAVEDLVSAAAVGGGAPGEPFADLAERLRAATDVAEHVRLAYGEAKPALAEAARCSVAALSATAPADVLEVLVTLALQQERHAGELPAGHAASALGLQRDPVVEFGPGGPALDAAVAAADAATRRVRAGLGSSPEELLAAAREVAIRLRRVAEVEAELLS